MTEHLRGVMHLPFSEREAMVAEMVWEADENRRIAERLGLSVKTIEGHIEHIKEKTGCRNRVEIALWWERGIQKESA